MEVLLLLPSMENVRIRATLLLMTIILNNVRTLLELLMVAVLLMELQCTVQTVSNQLQSKIRKLRYVPQFLTCVNEHLIAIYKVNWLLILYIQLPTIPIEFNPHIQ